VSVNDLRYGEDPALWGLTGTYRDGIVTDLRKFSNTSWKRLVRRFSMMMNGMDRKNIQHGSSRLECGR
jgi:hypothetical protein